ncbi:PRTRC system ThiF family protein [Undibacterium oligocarboniphilum]|uniref:PRTRC system ThiF family protein n=1 Tax=Undibacterium oligocarboniphilum TaxID=666702 RepID=A0A850QRH6_9BURK|nr:PRTRC system ThiF family protein [Undibacterium oligocarboniphilum]MBC3871774.1 PRTRC system ThiF family protein [Undibacterium oligocarboniphilum]NVO79410.1 PRTRC system ThiF family protein [Undibacterium oligocarboniphilum]
MKHHIHSDLLTDKVNVLVVGAGGTGSQILSVLARQHHAMLAFGHPHGLDVMLWDDDTVSETNLFRQAFYPCDVGSYKSHVVINRINLGFGTQWKSEVKRLSENDKLSNFDIIIGCVDNRAGRQAILKAWNKGQSYSNSYWLDCGNRLSDGQIVLGELPGTRAKQERDILPHVGNLYPELLDPFLDETDVMPSCSVAEALEKQSLFVNSAMAMYAGNILNELFRHGAIDIHGYFVNLKTGRSSPLEVDPVAWERMGYRRQVV